MKHSYKSIKNLVKNNNVITVKYNKDTDLVSVLLNDKNILTSNIDNFHSGIKNLYDIPSFDSHLELVEIIELYCLKLGKQVIIKNV